MIDETPWSGMAEMPFMDIKPERGAFLRCIQRETAQFVKDAKAYGWDMQVAYWQMFSEWPWWRQAIEIMALYPWRRLNRFTGDATRTWRCWMLRQHLGDEDQSPYRDAFCDRCGKKLRGPIDE